MAIKVSGTTVIDDSRNINAGIISASEFAGSGDNLLFSPSITSFSPRDGETGVTALNDPPNIVLVFSQEVSLGTTSVGVGTTPLVEIRKTSATGTLVENFSVGITTRVTISNQTLTIIPTDKFDYDSDFFVVVPVNTVINKVGGSNKRLTTYNFATEAGPGLSTVSPGFGTTSVNLSTNILLSFDKNIRAGSGTITLRTGSSSGTIVESYDVTSSDRLTFSGDTLTIDPTNNLGVGLTHFVVLPDDAVAGFSGISTYEFQAIDFTLGSIAPPDGATNVGVSTNITLTFVGGSPVRGTGSIQIKSNNSSTGTVVETFDAASSDRISVSGLDYIINPTNDLGVGVTFFTIIPDTAIGNFTGLNTSTADPLFSPHSFTTPVPALGDSYGGGYLICKASPTRWVVAPSGAEVQRSFNNNSDAATRAQEVSGCTGWFTPSISQLQNPGYTCRTHWDSYTSDWYWSSSAQHSDRAYCLNMSNGSTSLGSPDQNNRNDTRRIRAFRTVTY